MQQGTALMFISSENMAITRIQPLSSHLNTFASPANPIQDKQVYTVWMKSLVFNGHGCTIYGQDGRVAYLADNYACHRRREVYVMDSGGKAMIKLLKKNFGGVQGMGGLFLLQWPRCGEVYKIDAVPHKSEYRISDPNGEVVAKMQRKQTASGVVLGEDVLSLTVNPTADRLVVVGLVVVCGLLSRCI
nr:unnamed protein product [Digitaria exilis]